jgi:GNAT superfamily N-acetyltransferase
MRFKDFLQLNEMPNIEDNAGVLANEKEYWNYTVYRQIKNYTEKYEKTIDSVIYKFCLKNYGNTYGVVAYVKEKIVGFISVNIKYIKKEPPMSYPYVGWVAVNPEYRNKKIAENLYKIIIDEFGGICSDDLITTQAINFWENVLFKKYNVYYASNNKDLENYKKLELFDKKTLNDYDIILIASKEKL